MNRKWGIVLIGIGLLVLVGTVASYYFQGGLIDTIANNGKVVEEGKQTFDPANVKVFEIHNPVGRTHVTAHPNAKAVTIAYQKRQAGGFWGFESVAAAAKRVTITLQNDSTGGREVLDTSRPVTNWLRKQVTVDYEITVPPTLELNIQSTVGPVETNGMNAPVTVVDTTGSITIDGYKGKADARLTTGPVVIRGAADNKVAVNAGVTTGSVEVGVPSDANVNVIASTTTGSITTDFRTLEGSIEKHVPGHRLNGSTGKSGSDGSVDLHVVTGSIDIRHE